MPAGYLDTGILALAYFVVISISMKRLFNPLTGMKENFNFSNNVFYWFFLYRSIVLFNTGTYCV